MKKLILLFSLLFLAFLNNAQQTKTQAQFSIDNLLPSGAAVKMTEFAQCFIDAGFDWGGDWAMPRTDGMHFQLKQL